MCYSCKGTLSTMAKRKVDLRGKSVQLFSTAKRQLKEKTKMEIKKLQSSSLPSFY